MIDAKLVYDGRNLTMTLTDTKTGASVTEQYTVNISSIVGSTSAYVGFTASTGAGSANQQIKSWTYSAQ